MATTGSVSCPARNGDVDHAKKARPLIAEIVATLEVVEMVASHADLVINLVKRTRELLDGGEESAKHSLEAQRALASGMAAARAVAVQEAHRRDKAKATKPG